MQKHPAACFQVLEQYYGRTLVFPSLDAAASYRAAVKQHNAHPDVKRKKKPRIPLPNIITLDGNKMESAGAMYGKHNTAPNPDDCHYGVRRDILE